MQDLEVRRKRIETVAKVGILGVTGFLVAPFIFIAIKGAIGLVIAAAVGLTVVNVGAPWFAMKIANWRLKAIKDEAARNPVETLQNDLRDKSIALDTRKTNIEKLNGQIRTFSDRVDDIKSKYGQNDSGYVKLSRDLGDLRRIYAHRCNKWKEAKVQLDLFAEEIERANMIWEAAQAAAAARETSGLTEDEFYAKLRTETAFDSIENSYNEALASLDTAMLDEPKIAAQLPEVNTGGGFLSGDSTNPEPIPAKPSANRL